MPIECGTYSSGRLPWLLNPARECVYPDGGVGVFVTIPFRECCRLFPEVLGAYRERGYPLSRLDVFSCEEGCMGKPDPVVSHVDLAVRGPRLVERDIVPLRGLVDGLVVFSGYRFCNLMSRQVRPSRHINAETSPLKSDLL